MDHKPNWGEAERLAVVLSTVDAGGETEVGSASYPVRPEPGKPYEFYCEDDGVPCPDRWDYWSGYHTTPAGLRADGSPKYQAGPHDVYNSYRLLDLYGNLCFGYEQTTATSASTAPAITTEFKSQTTLLPILGKVDPSNYRLRTTWTNDPAWPNGFYPSTLSVDCYDPDWGSCSVRKTIVYGFDANPTKAIERQISYEKRFGVDDGAAPFRVLPGATAAGIPKTSAGDARRLTLVAMQGSQYPASRPEILENPHNVWSNQSGNWQITRQDPQDPFLVTGSTPRFRLRVVDVNYLPVTGAEFRVHRCPRFDHEGAPQQSGPGGLPGRPCTVGPVDSAGGVIDSIEFNPPGAPRGYFGVELTRAPQDLGLYILDVQALTDTSYRIRRESDMFPSQAASGDSWGGFFFFVVDNRAEPDCRCGDAGCGYQNCTGSPVFAGSGLFTTSATDLTMPTAGFPLSVSRLYLSSSTATGLHGPGWRSSLEAKLQYVTFLGETGLAKAVDVTLPSGQRIRFGFTSGDGPFSPPPGRKDLLVKNPDATFDLTLERSRTVLHFDAKGRLTRTADEFGNAIDISYGPTGQARRISDASGSGRFIDVAWRGDGKIDRLDDSAGRRVQYGYDGQGNLSTVTDPAGRVTRYSYNTGSYGPLLTGIADHWQRPVTVITYDTADRATAHSEGGETYSYSYVDTTRTTKTDSAGNVRTFTFDDVGLITARTPPQVGTPASSTSGFDADGQVKWTQDETGVVTTYSYDTSGHVLTTTRDGGPAEKVMHEYGYDPVFPDKV
ncbi:MAG TPA: DUF6531 domain-containing protein, partial [Thermoanaerobaculia bacterium]|nr:DUF6531 domain-containing protein [Thermoanaerobaculia bacterium]